MAHDCAGRTACRDWPRIARGENAGAFFAVRCPFFSKPPTARPTSSLGGVEWGVVATQTRSIQAPVIAATNCNRFCGLAARWNANVQRREWLPQTR